MKFQPVSNFSNPFPTFPENTAEEMIREVNEIVRDAQRRIQEMRASPARMADADYVLRWVYQMCAEDAPANVHDLAARALGWPSMAHGHAEDP